MGQVGITPHDLCGRVTQRLSFVRLWAYRELRHEQTTRKGWLPSLTLLTSASPRSANVVLEVAVPCHARSEPECALLLIFMCAQYFLPSCECVPLPDADCTLALPFNVRPSVDARHEPRPSHEGEMLPREAATSIISIMHEACIDHSHGNLSG